MTVRATFTRAFSKAFTSDTLHMTRRGIARMRRGSGPGTVHYFHQADDPYSDLAAQTLSPLMERYRIRLEPHLVSAPDDAAAPERARLKKYALRDAARLARRYGLTYPDGASEPASEATATVNAQLAHVIANDSFVERAASISAALWQGATSNAPASGEGVTRQMMVEGDELRRNLGHYLSGMFYFDAGLWGAPTYRVDGAPAHWGQDRLWALEEDLKAAIACAH